MSVIAWNTLLIQALHYNTLHYISVALLIPLRVSSAYYTKLQYVTLINQFQQHITESMAGCSCTYNSITEHCGSFVTDLSITDSAAGCSPGDRRHTTAVVLDGSLPSQLHAGVSQGRICSDICTCCHTEIEAADQTFFLIQ